MSELPLLTSPSSIKAAWLAIRFRVSPSHSEGAQVPLGANVVGEQSRTVMPGGPVGAAPSSFPVSPVRCQGGVSGSRAVAEAWRIVPAPPISARRHGATPSISVSSEKLRNVLIATISPST